MLWNSYAYFSAATCTSVTNIARFTYIFRYFNIRALSELGFLLTKNFEFRTFAINHDKTRFINPRGKHMKSTNKVLPYLIILTILDTFIPIPFTGILLIYVLLEKPVWFRDLVSEIYTQGKK